MATQSEVVFRISDTLMYWPWPRKINPHHEEVKAASDAWFRSLNASGPEAQRVFERCDSSMIFPPESQCVVVINVDPKVYWLL
ncbi:uncharacterized protein ARMOST_19984 [Armillaria ostoyae]|uniref:Uncharacterized protein n=1 Tax=Armillaria ostoyae TaxID=47428 RepID=A0A284S639_ARMOS|nr:uncharacterized protein ARMOST_19984 [Armillaria ostoyae]